MKRRSREALDARRRGRLEDEGGICLRLQEPGRGFTLIELLVVIAIIAILISILVPSLTSAKRLVKRTMCSSNLHHCGLALSMYAHENNGHIPTASPVRSSHMFWWQGNEGGRQGMQTDKGEYYIVEIMRGYVDDWDIWVCPATTALPLDHPDNDLGRDACYGTYSLFPGEFYPQYGNENEAVPSSLDQLSLRRWTIMQDYTAFYERKNPTYWRGMHGVGSYTRWEDCPSYSYMESEDKAAGANILLGDFSAAWYDIESLEDVGRTHESAKKQLYGLMP
jgi:prepilin-type N-terminal cleavage/methylation domain-containing protein